MHSLIKTTLYLGLLTGLLLFAGQIIGGVNGLLTMFLFSIIMNLAMYYWSDKIVLAMHGAKEASRDEAGDLYNLIDEVRKKAKLPMPKVYLADMPVMNAFATGRNPKHAVVAVTPLITQHLTREELKAVIGHELTHVKNYDTLISTISAMIAGTISMIARMAFWFGAGNRDERNSGVEMISFLILVILTPILALLIRLAISRVREYSADKGGAELAGPREMISALEKLHLGPKITMQGDATSHMFIVNPFADNAIVELLSTHPTLDKRVERIKEEFKI